MEQDNKSLVLQSIDLVELVGQSVALKRRGREFFGLCPFHQEKSPSFKVDPTKQFFYCFGCKAAGNAIDFVMRRDRMEFRDALESLARHAGIELRHSPGAKQKAGEKQQLLDAHQAACQLFETHLHSTAGQLAREYLAQRGFDAETLKRFRVGLAPESWDDLLRSDLLRKFPPALLSLAGLVKPRTNGEGFYDTFRNRIMFPIRDESGRIIAFGGRVMPGADDPAKYLNSPETPLFSKGRTIFGLDQARQKIVETRTVAVVEGYTDVIMAHQYGAANVVSVLGTAMTEQHVNVLRRFADKIVLLFDADTAGDLAVNRVVQLFLTQPVDIAVASMPEGVDPDEFLLTNGLDGFNKMLAEASDALAYGWRQTSRRFNASQSLTAQQKATQEYLQMLAEARGSGPVDSLRWGATLARVSRLTQIPLDDLQRRFKMRRERGPAPSARVSTSLAETAPADDASDPRPPLTGRQLETEHSVLGVLLADSAQWHNVQSHMGVEDFGDAALGRLAQIYWDHQRDQGEPVFNEFLAELPDDALRQLAIELLDEVGRLGDLRETLDGALGHLSEMKNSRLEQETFVQARGGDVAALRKLQEQRRQPDLRRVGR